MKRPDLLRGVPVAMALAVSSCVVGPDFERPAAPPVGTYTAAPVAQAIESPAVPGGGAQHLLAGADLPGAWWELFHSQPLNGLIARSLANNPDLKAAQAALDVARENVLAQRGGYYPSVTGSISAGRSKTSADISPTPNSGDLSFTVYTPQVSVSYLPDVFGLNRRAVESLQAQADQQRFALVAAHIALSGNVVAAAIAEASIREQIAVTHQLIDNSTRTLEILRNQLARGYASRLDVATQEAQLAQIVATLPPLEKALAQQRTLLTALAGSYPTDAPAETFRLAELQLPQDVPLSVPSQLVEHRPDVRQAEENLHSASALVGVAVANRLPVFSITAGIGSMALGKVFGGGTNFWNVGADLAQPLFQGRTLQHRERAARAAYVEAAERYRSAAVTAFQNVADALNALEQDARSLKYAVDAADAAKVTLDLTRQQLEAGAVSVLATLNAETAYGQALLAVTQARASRYADTAALFVALGGGWWNREELAGNETEGDAHAAP